jgi:hypothetical protein
MNPSNARGPESGNGSDPQNAQLGGTSDKLNRPTPAGPQVLGYIEKNARERIRVSLNAYAGRSFLDVRIVVQAPDGSDRPTKLGVTLRPDRISDLQRLVEVAATEAKRRWLIGAAT